MIINGENTKRKVETYLSMAGLTIEVVSRLYSQDPGIR